MATFGIREIGKYGLYLGSHVKTTIFYLTILDSQSQSQH